MYPAPSVLLVEESPTSARATASLLTDGTIGARVHLLTSGSAALAYLHEHAIDLMILDLSLSDDQGLNLLSAVRADHVLRALPVVVLSGTTDASIVERSYDLGANCFVRKPRRIAELVPAVRAIEQFWIRHRELLPLVDHSSSTAVTLPLPATADGVREARATVRRLVEGWGLAGLGETAELCASELATNAVLHAHSPVLLGIALLPDTVRVEVEDEAPGSIEPGSLVDGASENGRGLAIVDALTESWGVDQHPDGKTVWFELRRPEVP